MSAAAASVLLGAGLVTGVLGAGLLVVLALSRAAPTAVAPALAMLYVVKALVLGWVLLNVDRPGWLEPWWFAGAVLVSIVGWLSAQGVVVARLGRETASAPGTASGADPEGPA